MTVPDKATNIAYAERQMTAHGDTAKHEASKHLKAADLALRHGETDNAEAHVLDAIRLMGRAQAFYDLAEDMLADAFDGDRP